MKNWQSEFPNFPRLEMPKIPDGFEDVSWRNDACPNFVNDDLGLILFVEPASVSERSGDFKRFTLYTAGEGGMFACDSRDVVAEADDWYTIIKYIEGRR